MGNTNEDHHWVFGYGSLIWNPGFDYILSCTAVVEGYQRRLCILSHNHRGTRECPGLVFGLAPGGICEGRMFAVHKDVWPETLAYLRRREQPNDVYLETEVTACGDDGIKRKALTFVSDPEHQQYAGELGVPEMLKLIAQGQGGMGFCTDYVLNTHESLTSMGIEDTDLNRIVSHLHKSE